MITKALKDWLDSLKINATPDMDECLLMLGDVFPLLKEFKNTPQDAEWHAEGDVHIHTDMVLKELYKLFDDGLRLISPDSRQTLILAALLHDIAKPICTGQTEIGGKIRIGARHHEAKGRDYLTFKLLDLKLDNNIYMYILNLVGEHQKPKMLVVKDKGFGAYVELADQVDMKLVYWLEVADMKGRTCSDLDIQLMYLEEFKSKCIQYNLWYSFRPIASPEIWEQLNLITSWKQKWYTHDVGIYKLKHNVISVEEEIIPSTYKHRENHSHVIILCGISGSGKSTFVNNWKTADYAVISLDALREEYKVQHGDASAVGKIRQIATEQLKECLRNKKNVIWDATCTREIFRSQIIQIVHDYNGYSEIVAFFITRDDAVAQNNKRVNPLDESIIDQQIANYQFPLKNEAHLFRTIYV